MAKQKGFIKLKGSLGGLTFYEQQGKSYVNPKNSYIFYYKAKLPAIIENAQNLFSSELGYNYFTKKFLRFPILLVF